jgi:hypothetical protein
MTQPWLTADATCITKTEDDARSDLAGAFEKAGLADADWPLSTTDATHLLREAFEFEVTEEQVVTLGELGQVPAVEAWDARDVLAAAAALNARRQWFISSPMHAGKIHQSERDLAACLVAGDAGKETLDRSFRGLDLRMVLILLTECKDREPRERWLTTAFYLLARDHGVVV